MLTIDDCNSIIEKYGDVGFWVDIDMANIPLNVPKIYNCDGVTIEIERQGATGHILCHLSPFINGIYLTNHNGDILNINISSYSTYYSFTPVDNNLVIHIFVSKSVIPSSLYNNRVNMFVPLSSLQIPVINGEFDDKFYVKKLGTFYRDLVYTINGVDVPLETDEHGTYVTLPSAEDCYVGCHEDYYHFYPFRISFIKLKELPIVSIPTLYRGTPQNIQVINTDTEEPITEFQSYYQGRLLRNNQINLPYNAPDYIDIVVDLKDPEYPYTRVKLKAPTTIYTANTQSDVEDAISQGIQTLQIGDNETEVQLNNITLNNVTLINSNIQLTESTLTQCRIINTEYTDNGLNNINNTIFETTNITSTETSTIYTECTLTESTITNTELHITGTLTENTFNNSLIISDGIIRITNNTFNGVGEKTYFPSHLYLTGDYTVTGNTFTLTGEWTELEFNICLIKTLNTFNPSEFINTNTLHLNITYETEPTNTLYYNIIDDDKIKAVKLQ